MRNFGCDPCAKVAKWRNCLIKFSFSRIFTVISWSPLKPGESVGLETCESLLYKKMYDKFSIQFNNMQIIVAKVSCPSSLYKIYINKYKCSFIAAQNKYKYYCKRFITSV